MSNDPLAGVIIWRGTLGAISVFNICAWLLVATTYFKKSRHDPAERSMRRWQLLLSALFVVGCAFRAFIPRADVQRICLHDSWISSVMVGRSVATIAELAFVGQCALLLYGVAKGAHARALALVSRLIVPMIVVAECFSWYAVLTTNYIGNVVEESIWAFTSALVTASFVVLWSRTRPGGRRFLGKSIAVGLLYLVFMCTVDVPTYLSRWATDERGGRQYLSLSEGIRDSSLRWVVTHDWQDWQEEVPWMSLYFSVGVWISLALTRAPTFADAPEASAATAPVGPLPRDELVPVKAPRS